jgi:hypothetical protein
MTACPNYGFSETIVSDPSRSTVITDLCQQLADLETETTGVLHQLEQQKNSLKQHINAHRSPLLRLPPEITSEIFMSYLAYHGYTVTYELDGHFDLLITKTPLLFGRICSAWRKLAWSTPRLWCSLLLDLERHKIDPVLVEQWIKRSCGLPLSIWAFLVYDTEEFHASSVAIMHVIAQHSQRWCNIVLDLPFFCYESLEHIKGHLPNLQSIAIDHEYSGLSEQRDTVFQFTMFSDTPLLRSLTISRLEELNQFAFPTDNLTKLRLLHQPINESLEMLQRSPRLIQCDFIDIQGHANAQLIHILADQLESLKLMFFNDYPDRISDVFDALTIPALRELFFDAEGFYFPHSSFISLITRSSCSLQTLTLKFIRISDDELLEVLQVVPSLQKLSLIKGSITNETLWMLSSCDPNILLPNLKVFGYSSGRNLHFDFSAIVSFLRSRWDDREIVPSDAKVSSIPQLQSVEFDTGVPDPDSMTQLQRFVKEGMDIKLTVHGRRLL